MIIKTMTTRIAVEFFPDISPIMVDRITSKYNVKIEKPIDIGYILTGDINALHRLIEDPAVQWFTALDRPAYIPLKRPYTWRNEHK